ncbi:MAG: hypothetical protein LUG13_10210 [Oscillospiraceae bacterium]|nr:hypothetical protein [Oscillospiraceae bacterium]
MENKEMLAAIQEMFTQQKAETKELLAQQEITTKELLTQQEITTKELLAQQEITTKELLTQQEITTKELLAQQEIRTKELLAQQKAEILDETTRNIKFLLDTEVQTRFNLLAEGQQIILEKLVPASRVEALEEDVQVLKTAVRQLSEDMEQLKRA